MTLFKRSPKTPDPEAGPEKRSIISRRFIIAISAIYSVLIIGTAAAYHVAAQKNAAILRDALAAQGQELLAGMIDSRVEALKSANAATPGAVKTALLAGGAPAGDLHAVIIFTKTEDENYFRIADTVVFNQDFRLDLGRSEVVRERKDISYLKKGLIQTAVDPDIYSQGAYTWQNVFYPYEFSGKKGVLQFMASAARTQEIIEGYAAGAEKTRNFMIALMVVLVIAVSVLSIIFAQNYLLLIRNLSRFMTKAAEGDLNVSLNAAEDVELNQLALSFNTLIDELKEKSSRGTETPAGQDAPQPAGTAPGREAPESPEGAAGPESPGAIFAAGVSFLKEDRLDDAIAIFTTMTIIKPNGFGSFFNLGVAYAKKREYQKALRMFEAARAINPSYEVTSAYIEKIRRLQKSNA